VVDNASNEDIAPRVENYPHASLFFQHQQGSYAARNKGISEAKGYIVAFTDSDCIPASDWIEKGVTELIRIDNCGIIGGRVNLFYENRSNPAAVEIYDRMTFFQQSIYIKKAHFSVTANLFTYKNVFEKVGLFNAQLASGGDVEWCRRVHASGFDLHYAADASVAHPARHSFLKMIKKVTRVTKGQIEMDLHQDNFVKKSIEILSKDLLPPITRIRRIWVCKYINGYSKKVKVTAILLFMKYIAVIEKFFFLICASSAKHLSVKNFK